MGRRKQHAHTRVVNGGWHKILVPTYGHDSESDVTFERHVWHGSDLSDHFGKCFKLFVMILTQIHCVRTSTNLNLEPSHKALLFIDMQHCHGCLPVCGPVA